MKYVLILLFPIFSIGQTTKTIKVNVPGYGDCNVIIYDPVPGVKSQAVVMIPGDGEVGTDANRMYTNGPLKFVKAGWKPAFKVIGAQPLGPHAGPPFVHAVLTELSKPSYNITSFSLTGLSGGAYSALTYVQGQSNPVPVKNIVSMSTVSEYGTTRIDQFKNIPVWNFVGDADGFAYNETIAFDKALKSAGYNSRITIYKGGHSGWNTFYDPAWKENGQSIYDYMLNTGTGTVPPVVDPPIVIPPVTPPISTATRKYLIPSGEGGLTVKKNGLVAGDTGVLRVKDWAKGTYCSFDSVIGTATKPIVIINEGGQVQLINGFGITNCQYMKITGTGSNDEYGFKIKDIATDAAGVAVSIGGKSRNIEVSNLFINHKEYGFWIKNEAECDESINYPNWTLDNMYVHDCYIRQMDSQGFYMGSTDPNNLDRAIICNGVTKNYAPSRLGNIRIYNNRIDSTGRPGIQLSGAMTGSNEISYNTVSNTGLQKDDAQGTGISLGGYTRAYVHHNNVSETFTWGVASLGGSGLIIIEDNSIDKSSSGSVTWASNIAVGTRTTIPPDSTTFVIRNNILGKIGSTQKYNIEVSAPKPTFTTTGNIICGNKLTSGADATYNVESGIKFSTCGVVTPPIEYSSIAVSGIFTRNNCPAGNTAGSVTYTVPAGKYKSTNQTDANALAKKEVDNNGQAYANANGTCTPVVTPPRKLIKTIRIYDNNGRIEIEVE